RDPGPCARNPSSTPALRNYILAASTVPCLSVHSLADAVSVQPLPLHSFFDLQELSAPEQEPCPRHSLMPAHFTTSAFFLPALPLAIAAPERNIEATALAMTAFFTFIV